MTIIRDTNYKRILELTNHGIIFYPKTITDAVWDLKRKKTLAQLLDEGFGGGTNVNWGSTSNGYSPLDVAGLSKTVALQGHSHGWAELTGIPSTFNPSPHTHEWIDILGKPTTFAPAAHDHNASDINAGVLAIARIPTGLTGTTVALGNHTHTWALITAKPTTIGTSGITDVYTKEEVDDMIDGIGGGGTWGSIIGTITNQTDLISLLNAKLDAISAGTISLYYRGDKSWQTLNKAAVGLSNVDNTSDANKPVSTALQLALNAKLNTLTAGAGISIVGNTISATGGGVADSVEWENVLNKPSVFNPAVHTHPFTEITGTASTALIPNLAASKITSGTFNIARIPTGTTSTTVALGEHEHVVEDITDFPEKVNLVEGANITITESGNDLIISSSSGGSTLWGNITGSISNLTDLNNALAPISNAIDIESIAIDVNTVAVGLVAGDNVSFELLPNGDLEVSSVSGGIIVVSDPTESPLGSVYLNQTYGNLKPGDEVHALNIDIIYKKGLLDNWIQILSATVI